MRKVLFICHGNICRSVMAEFICRYRRPEIVCASAAVSYEEEGNDIYPPAKRCLQKHGIPFERHYARRVERSDYDLYDEIYVMDSYNMRNILRIMSDPDHKIARLCPYDIEDPWYTDNFELVYRQICEGIDRL